MEPKFNMETYRKGHLSIESIKCNKPGMRTVRHQHSKGSHSKHGSELSSKVCWQDFAMQQQQKKKRCAYIVGEQEVDQIRILVAGRGTVMGYHNSSVAL